MPDTRPTLTPVEFLNARLDEIRAAAIEQIEWDRREAKQLGGASVIHSPLFYVGWTRTDWVLAWCEAMRAVIKQQSGVLQNGIRYTVAEQYRAEANLKRFTALFSDHLDYQESWRP